ncbi:hypothetical protein BaRGS_00029125 [Batillaria attramentaria]|uniref:Uncharacterized protein n=1 Tax=Batillaria attramentaria TaxID=370345 RepID=A0ABD0JX57_9CAEN
MIGCSKHGQARKLFQRQSSDPKFMNTQRSPKKVTLRMFANNNHSNLEVTSPLLVNEIRLLLVWCPETYFSRGPPIFLSFPVNKFFTRANTSPYETSFSSGRSSGKYGSQTQLPPRISKNSTS